MPEACFSYSTGSCFSNPTGGSCFSYPAGPCFSYPAGPCFSYSSGAPRAAGDLPGIFGSGGGVMGPCFSYTGARTTHPNFTGGTCFRY